jgi:hypothetical protein
MMGAISEYANGYDELQHCGHDPCQKKKETKPNRKKKHAYIVSVWPQSVQSKGVDVGGNGSRSHGSWPFANKQKVIPVRIVRRTTIVKRGNGRLGTNRKILQNSSLKWRLANETSQNASKDIP